MVMKMRLGRQAIHCPGLEMGPAFTQIFSGQGEETTRTAPPAISRAVFPKGPPTENERGSFNGRIHSPEEFFTWTETPASPRKYTLEDSSPITARVRKKAIISNVFSLNTLNT